MIPFFVGDNENKIFSLLKKGKVISFNEKIYQFPQKWQYLWGVTNDNKPLKGKDFEMANFNDDEIAKVLSDILAKEIVPSQVQEQRINEKGIKQVDGNAENYKKCIAEKLISNLFNEYKNTKDELLFERPMFKMVDKVLEIADFNYRPHDTEMECANKNQIEEELRNGEQTHEKTKR